jgi:hypothetical protein
MPLGTLHTDSPSLVPSRASTPTTTSLRLGTRALTRLPRCVRPTSANHSSSYPVPVLSVSDLASSGSCFFRATSGAIGGSVVSRRSGPASVGRAATRRGFGPREPRWVSPWRWRSWSRSVHDFTSDIPSPAGSRFRLRRTACVMTEGSRPLLPPPVKVTASHDPRCLPPHRRRDSLAAAPPPWSCDSGGVVHHLLAARIAFRLRVRQTTIENRILQPEILTHGHDHRARDLLPRRCCRPVRVSTGA